MTTDLRFKSCRYLIHEPDHSPGRVVVGNPTFSEVPKSSNLLNILLKL